MRNIKKVFRLIRLSMALCYTSSNLISIVYLMLSIYVSAWFNLIFQAIFITRYSFKIEFSFRFCSSNFSYLLMLKFSEEFYVVVVESFVSWGLSFLDYFAFLFCCLFLIFFYKNWRKNCFCKVSISGFWYIYAFSDNLIL